MSSLDINTILPDEITKISANLMPLKISGSLYYLREVRGQVAEIIDRLGRHSAAAQGLSSAITTSERLIRNESFITYVMKDKDANNGHGEAIGMLKIGRKHLYLNDPAAKLHEVEPWCILDFFIEPTYQRHGLGKKLVDYMIEDIDTPIKYIAIDGPSQSMLRFLAKNYGLNNIIIQANNFALADDFFEHLDEIRAASGNVTPAVSSAGAGRYTAAPPRSAIATVIHGGSPAVVSSAAREEEFVVDWGEMEECAPAPPPPPSDYVEDWDAEMAVEAAVAERERELAEERARAAERPSTLPVEPAAAAEPAAPAPAPEEAASPAAGLSSRRDSQLTDKGYFDVKFYHNKLW